MITRAEILKIKSLADKRGRDEHGLFVAEGEKIIRELLLSELCVERIYALEGVLEDCAGVCRVTRAEMERISMLKTANSSLALVRKPEWRFDAGRARDNLVLALDGVSNPGNLGTLIRLADWFGIGDVICSPESADCFNPKVVQATMGAIIRVRVHYCSLPEVLGAVRGEGIPVYGTFLGGENIYEAGLSSSGVIVMGNEGRGISESVAALVSHRLFIPPWPSDRCGSESLNVSVAAAIACSEFRRR